MAETVTGIVSEIIEFSKHAAGMFV